MSEVTSEKKVHIRHWSCHYLFHVTGFYIWQYIWQYYILYLEIIWQHHWRINKSPKVNNKICCSSTPSRTTQSIFWSDAWIVRKTLWLNLQYLILQLRCWLINYSQKRSSMKHQKITRLLLQTACFVFAINSSTIWLAVTTKCLIINQLYNCYKNIYFSVDWIID